MSTVTVSHKNTQAEVEVPEFDTLREYQGHFGARELMHMVKKAIAAEYRAEARKRLARGDKGVAEAMKDWKAPGPLPPTLEELQAKKDREVALKAAKHVQKLTDAQRAELAKVLSSGAS